MHKILYHVFVYISLSCFTPSSLKVGPDLHLLKYLARCRAFSELSINV